MEEEGLVLQLQEKGSAKVFWGMWGTKIIDKQVFGGRG